jgi:superfamily II DNA/RNA helicase
VFDPTTAQLLRSAPAVRGLAPEDIPALLTRHYANLVSARLRGAPDDPANAADPWPPERIADTYELIASLSSNRAVRAASAFVAGTAQQILARRRPTEDVTNNVRPNVDRDRVDPTLSAAVLFLAAEQYADANEAASDIAARKDRQTYEASILSENIIDLARGQLRPIIARAGRWRREPNLGRDLEARAFAALLETLTTGIEILAADFLGVPTPEIAVGRFDTPRGAFVRVLELSGGFAEIDGGTDTTLHTYAGPHHLASLLIAAADGIAPASLIKLPPPAGADPEFWRRWLNLRASLFPFIWQNHREAIAKEFHQTGKSAVVVLPTGAGKTTVSALKIAGVLARGRKVVFLAPTHALVEQLTENLQEMFPQEILGSVVSSDFDLLFQSGASLREIEVMTPERCLAMLSFAPDAFIEVGLLVFDECHLLAPQHDKIRRSLDAMLCLLAFVHVVPDADLLFLSAMLKNAGEFAKWIGELTERDCVCVDLLWKPSRQARGVVIYKDEDLSSALQLAAAMQRKGNAKEGKKAKSLRAAAASQLEVPALAIWGLQHNWLQGATAETCSIQSVLDEPVLLASAIKNGTIAPTPNANKVAGRLAVAAARNGLKSIVFVNTKSDAITVARDIAAKLDREIEPTEAEQERWTALRAELGDLQHAVLPQPAVAVPHNSSMLRLERDLAERMFRRSNGASVIVATPTLAQGLNLPAHLAILAGDKRADTVRRGRESLEAHEILNAAARAGRAGHVANGVVLLIPEPIISYSGSTLPRRVIEKLKSVLPEDDRCVVISDPLEIVLDRLMDAETLDPDALYVVNRMAALGESEGIEEPTSLFDLRKSLGAFAARNRAAEAEFNAKITDLKVAIARNTPDGVDLDVAVLASQSGLSMHLLSRLKNRIANDVGSLPTDVEGWLEWTLRWLGDDKDARESLLHDVNRAILGACGRRRDGDVTATELSLILPGLLAWIHGRPLVDIEAELGGEPQSTTFTKRICPRARELVGSVIPRGLSFVVGLVSHVVGEMDLIPEQDGLNTQLIESLATAVRKGYDTPDKVTFAGEHPTVLSRVQMHGLWMQQQN